MVAVRICYMDCICKRNGAAAAEMECKGGSGQRPAIVSVAPTHRREGKVHELAGLKRGPAAL